jgi:hypothetical protein
MTSDLMPAARKMLDALDALEPESVTAAIREARDELRDALERAEKSNDDMASWVA